MPSLVTRLISLKASDVMTRDPVTLQRGESIASAVETLERHQITGAPVVDSASRLIGVLSLWDVVRSRQGGGGLTGRSGEVFRQNGDGPQKAPENARALRFAAGGSVVDSMSPTVSGVSPDQLLVEVARKMCIAHWHRVPVVGADGKLIGIISTMDVLAALVNMFDELK
jgi:CBS-domain-containing membrane protein